MDTHFSLEMDSAIFNTANKTHNAKICGAKSKNGFLIAVFHILEENTNRFQSSKFIEFLTENTLAVILFRVIALRRWGQLTKVNETGQNVKSEAGVGIKGFSGDCYKIGWTKK